ncbi:protein kinase domain-containing protein [Nonomuraea longicatena]|uniref:Protein kinase domain-containing protein n=1 Tax=Nonomuraea longicatena TaxID=83682 RepID=A0ABN1R341_9ACTN
MNNDPDHLAGYWIAGRLGSGARGVVYEAYDDAGDRFALRVQTHPLEPGGRARLEKAAEVASPCVARLLAAGTQPVPHLVTEFVAGASLRVRVGEAGPYAGGEVHALAIGVATALAAVHGRGLAHGDLRPDNVLIGPDGPRVVDFGLAAGSEAEDVRDWGRLVRFAADGESGRRATLGQPLRDLVEQALDADPGRRPTARDLLLKLLDTAQDPLTEGAQTARALACGPEGPTLGDLAEEVYGGLSRREQQAVPDVFLRLVEAGGADGRRTAVLAELLDEAGAAAGPVVGRYREAGLLLAGETVTLAHAALVRAWPRLREWLDAERDGLTRYRTLAESARAWDRGGRRRRRLLGAEDLDAALSWAATGRRHLSLGAAERAFLDESTARGRRRTRRRRVLPGVLASLLVVASAVVGLTFYQGSTARQALTDTSARALAGRVGALRATDPATARRLSAAAWRLSPVAETRSAVLAAAADPVRSIFPDPDVGAGSVYAWGRSGQWLVAIRGGLARIWDPSARRLLMEVRGVGHSAATAALDDSGRLLAVGTSPEVRIFDTRSGWQLGTLPVRKAARVSFQGGLIATTDADGEHALWHPTGQRFIPRNRLSGERETVQTRQVGGRVASQTRATGGRATSAADGGGGPVLLPAHAGQPARLLTDGHRRDLPWLNAGAAEPTALSPDGRHVAAGTRLYASATGRKLADLPGTARRLAFSADGSRLAVGFEGRVTVLDTATGERLLSVRDPDGRTLLPSVSRDSLFFVGANGRARTYTLPAAPPDPIGRRKDLRVLSRDGRTLALAGDREVSLWDPVAGRRLGRLPVRAKLAAFSWNGTRLAVAAGRPDRVEVWDLATRTKVSTLDTGPATGLALSPDGRTVAVAEDGTVALHTGGQVRRVPEVAGSGLAFRPDGRVLAVYGESRVHTIDTTTATLTEPNAAGRAAGALAFSPDGRMAATGDPLGQVTLWDAGLRQPLGPAIDTGGRVGALAFSGDSRVLAVAGAELSSWDVATGTPLGRGPGLGGIDETPERDPYGRPAHALAAGADLVGVGPSGEVRTLVIDPERALGRICAQDGDLPPTGWAQHVRGLSPRQIC